MSGKKLVVLTTHPIQYQAHWFRALGAHPDLSLKVLFCHKATSGEQAAAGFGVEFDWDIPLLNGYSYRFLKNIARHPTVARFGGLDTPEIKDIISQERCDAVLVNGWHYKSAWQAIWACWKTETPVMVRGDSHLHAKRHPLKKALKYFPYRWFMRRFDACLAVGKWSREYYLHYGARLDRIFFVTHTIDDNFFSQESLRLAPERENLRRAWGIDENATVFLFTGKFIEKKRPMDFVQAIDRAVRPDRPVVGLMVGDGPLRPYCEAFVARKGTPIKFAGFLNQSQVVRSYVAADVLVLPSDGETWGLVVNEAMACGRPCIVSDQVGCGPDLVVSGETGSIFPMGDVEALAKSFLFYSTNRLVLKRMGERAREIARKYCVESAVEGVIHAIATIQNKRH